MLSGDLKTKLIKPQAKFLELLFILQFTIGRQKKINYNSY